MELVGVSTRKPYSGLSVPKRAYKKSGKGMLCQGVQ